MSIKCTLGCIYKKINNQLRELHKKKRKMKNDWIGLFLLFFSLSGPLSFGQVYPELLVGKWALKEKLSVEETKVTLIGGKKSEERMILFFYEDGKGYDHTSEVEFEYNVSGEELTLGNRQYRFIKLTKDILVIEEIESLVFLDKITFKFKRIES